MEAILSGLQIILSVVLIALILLHSGKDTGLSGAFGVGTGGGPFGGGSLVERNLNRWTVAFALALRGERDHAAEDRLGREPNVRRAQRGADHARGEAPAVELAVAGEAGVGAQRLGAREDSECAVCQAQSRATGGSPAPSSIRNVPSRVTAVTSASLGRTRFAYQRRVT